MSRPAHRSILTTAAALLSRLGRVMPSRADVHAMVARFNRAAA